MEDWLSWTITGVLFVVAVKLYGGNRDRQKRPPGPKRWPLLGNLPQVLARPLHLILTDMSRVYGSLVWLRMAGDDVLVVNSIDSAVDCFLKQGRVFAGRPRKTKTVEVLLGRGDDIIMKDQGPELKFYRKVVHGFLAAQKRAGRARLENILNEEAESLVENLAVYERAGVALDPKFHIARVVANVLCQGILNHRFDRVDENFHRQLRIVQDIVDNIESFNIVDLLPWLEVFPIPSWRRFKQSIKSKDEWISKIIQEHRDSQPKSGALDLLDILLEYQTKARENEDDSMLNALDDVTIGNIVYELFGGGIESTTMTILWFILYLVHHPEWQEKIANEIKEEVKVSGSLCSIDRRRCCNLEAAIKETLRLASVLPLGFLHRVTENTMLDDYHIPKDTLVIINMWAIHHDEKEWEDPYVFNPERFMDSSASRRKSYLPFGIGHRICLGSSIAKMEIFLFCAYLVYHFSLHSADGGPKPDIQGLPGLTLRPKPFKIQLKKRP